MATGDRVCRRGEAAGHVKEYMIWTPSHEKSSVIVSFQAAALGFFLQRESQQWLLYMSLTASYSAAAWEVKTQGCRLDDKHRVHDRLARRIQRK